MKNSSAVCCVVLLLWLCALVHAESGYDAWLRYAPQTGAVRAGAGTVPENLTILGDSPVIESAKSELIRGVHGMLGHDIASSKNVGGRPAIVLGTIADLRKAGVNLSAPQDLTGDGYWLTSAEVDGNRDTIITGLTDRGVLYGSFAWLNRVARGQTARGADEVSSPHILLRWINQWDNLDGSIERGYGGRSIFFDGGAVRSDLSRVRDYARLLASVGINGCVVNNVNASPNVLADDFIPQLARIADEFRPWGIRIGLSVNFASPKSIGGLDTFDPLDPRVAAWWKQEADELYRSVPDLGGFVLKADSEGRVGPSAYGRTHADAANVVARALKPHGGLLFYRGFVYDHHMDWRNLKNDRAKAAYENFHPLDGKFDDNVIIQIKNGPIDFQVREPASPLFSGLEHTNEAIELQITQEYLGQQRHLVFSVPLWKATLDFDMRVNGQHTPVKDIVAGKTFHRSLGGFAGVANVGLDDTWLGSILSMANLYGFGRLSWNPDLSAPNIIDEWTRLTFGNDPQLDRTIDDMQLGAWRVYENYTGPLGLQTLTNIVGPHYGPGPESADHNGWGQWIRSDHDGVGMDRTIATGTGFIGQYWPEVQKEFEPLAKCPDDLLLFFHHVPYTYRLHSGKTVIQEIYDLHYEGAASAQKYVPQWESLRGQVDEQRYASVLAMLKYQSGHAIVWRDAITKWFRKLSGIADAQGRVGHYPDRVEAESMQLQGYKPIDVVPWEMASGGKGIECPAQLQTCSATFQFQGDPGRYNLEVQYFDQNNGVSRYRVYAGGKQVSEWLADAHLPANRPYGDSSTRREINDVTLHAGEEIRIEGIPDSGERAPLDYVAIKPAVN